ncbi:MULTISPECIES: SigE family RNA polymerase sigma factor [Kitasatospora]|uniref:RNA polymerase sigma-70 factor (Sigma-E family) n=2 Tax=Kitasatospora TaxID=2063 RepID=A0ABT1IV91_9ACTN|nr:SigE family RNA polymerase sigma factor [Kitasatospora paracochleata]MCP2309052.1 RNA polymerase sigma-70 factor (sigma-E family) [Kitasatospora paracochleata]
MSRRSAVRQAEEDGFQEFAAARYGHLYRSACLLTSGDTHLAEDLVQEALVRMYAVWSRTTWLGIAGGRRIANPSAYAHSVLVRQFLTHRRRRSSTERPIGELPDLAADPADDSDLRVVLLRGLAQLSDRDRAVLVLRYWEDRSIEETAEIMRASSTSVRTRSYRALGRMRALLGDRLSELVAR